MTWLTQLVNAITSAFGELGTTILTFIKEGFTQLFLNVEEGSVIGPSELAIFMFFLIGVSLVIGLTTVVFRIVGNKGNI